MPSGLLKYPSIVMKDYIRLGVSGIAAVVSGGARPGGITECVVKFLVHLGMLVVFADKDPKGKNLEQYLRSGGGECFFIQADLRNPKDAERVVYETVDLYGIPKVLVAGVGGSRGCGSEILKETNFEQFIEAHRLNCGTAFNLMKPALEQMRHAEGDKACVIIGSINGVMGGLGEPAYATAKHGLRGLCRCLAAEYARDGIRINLIEPGSVPNPNSETWGQRMKDERVSEHLNNKYPPGRVGTPADIAGPILTLISPVLSGWMTGQVIIVDGGLTSLGDFSNHRADMKFYLPSEEEYMYVVNS